MPGPRKGSRKGWPRKSVSPPEVVLSPFRAEVLKKKVFGEWREHIEQAMDDARKLGNGSRVVAKDGTLLAKFENSVRYAMPHFRHRVA